MIAHLPPELATLQQCGLKVLAATDGRTVAGAERACRNQLQAMGTPEPIARNTAAAMVRVAQHIRHAAGQLHHQARNQA